MLTRTIDALVAARVQFHGIDPVPVTERRKVNRRGNNLLPDTESGQGRSDQTMLLSRPSRDIKLLVDCIS